MGSIEKPSLADIVDVGACRLFLAAPQIDMDQIVALSATGLARVSLGDIEKVVGVLTERDRADCLAAIVDSHWLLLQAAPRKYGDHPRSGVSSHSA